MMKNMNIYIVAIVAIAAITLLVMGRDASQPLVGQVTGFCTDSDGGVNLPVNGRTRTTLQKWAFDECKDEKTLVEYYCSGGEIESKTVDCVAEGYRLCGQRSCVH